MISQTQTEAAGVVWYSQPWEATENTKISTSKPLQQALDIANSFRQKNQSKAFVAISSNYFIIAACILVAQSASEAVRVPAWLAIGIYLMSVLVIAARMRGFENLVHEASHNNLFSTTQLHDQLQFLYAFPVFRLLHSYRRSHMMHHKHLGDHKKDPDVIRIHELGLHKLSDHPIWYLFGVPMTGFLTYEYCTTTLLEFWISPEHYLTKTVYWAVITLVLHCTHSFTLFAYYYIIPFLLVLPITRYWAEAAEHVGLDMTGVFGNARSNVGFLHRWYLHPHNDGYHAVHHLQSKVPFHALPQAHQSLMDESAQFRKFTVVSHGIGETFEQMSASLTIVKDVPHNPIRK